ncbi:MAG: exonuclease SbcC [Myxococcota bacterium]|jgi:exonuclease SbcC
MRILRVRGRNLASLTDFDIDFEQGTLGGVGLYAITGPTGSGKTTLLDAVCLALFDRTPRLHGQSRAQIGQVDDADDDRLGDRDPRAVLRRGTGEGFAAVDFIGVGGRRWRSIWRVWRSRKRPGGRLQPQTLELLDVARDHVVSSHRRREALELIRSKVGLSFEEFGRSVLLAQGGFAAFLRAPEAERAVLLERMTGTEVYARLSRAAFEQARESLEDVRESRARLQAGDLLGLEERGGLVGEGAGLSQTEVARAERLQAARQTLSWFAAQRQAAADHDAARSRLEPAELAVASARDAAEVADGYERALQLEPVLHRRGRAEERAKGLATSVADIQAASDRNGQEIAGLEAEAEAAGEAAGLVRASTEEAAPRIAAARRLEGQRTERATAEDTARVATQASAQQLARALADRDGAIAQRDAAGVRLRTASDWLEARPHVGLLAAHWGGWRERLVTLAAERSAVANHAPARGPLAVSAAAMGEKLARELAERQRLGRAEMDAQAASQEASGTLDAHRRSSPPEARRASERRVADQLAVVEGLRSLLDQGRQLAVGATSERGALQTAEAALERALADGERATAAARNVERQLEQLRGDLRVAVAAEELAARRPELLRDGEACPLCGSLEHPAGHSAGRGGDLARRLQLLVEQARAERDRHRRASAELGAAGERREEEALAAREELARNRDRQAVIESEWLRRVADYSGLPETLADGYDDLAAVARGLEARQTTLRTASARDDALSLAAATADKARADVVTASRAAADRLSAAREAAQAGQSLLAVHDEQASVRAGRAKSAEVGAAEVLALAAEWPGQFRQAPADFIAQRSAEVADYASHSQAVGTARDHLRTAEQAHATALTTFDLAQRRHDEASGQLTAAQSALAGTDTELVELLAGRTADAWSSELESRAEAAERRVTRARQAEFETRAEGTRLAAGIQARMEEQEHSRADLAEAMVAWETALATSGLETEARARHALVVDADTIKSLSQRREAAERAVRLRRAEHDAATTRLEAIETSRPDVDETVAVERAESLQAEYLEATRRLGAITELLDRDAAGRSERQAAAAQIELLERDARGWSQLSDLIGSASGSRFRVFAQSLTLERLLEHANHSLALLRPRFSLRRAPGHDLALMVSDHDMGGEVRSVESLSGGESFLVSLALALGLSGLSASQVPIESLFIDEGFGALDPESLDIALAGLDQVRATGRQIGIVSHVPELVERVGYRIAVVPIGPGRSRVEVGA